MGETKDIMVSIVCESFNHERFLRQCLDGFVMQKTNFAFEILIHDDASTDKSQDIIREYMAKYPELYWKPILQTENQYSKGVGIWRDIQFPRAKGKYIAICEGDDYWTDPLKLQKQVDFMESHPEYVLTCHRYQIYDVNAKAIEDDFASCLFKENCDGFAFSNKENFDIWITKTLTLLYRRDLLKNFPDSSKFVYWRDTHLNYYLLKQGKGYCLPFVGAMCRRHNGGVYSTLSEQQKYSLSVKIIRELFYANRDDKELEGYYHDLLSKLGAILQCNINICRNKKAIFADFKLLNKIYMSDGNLRGLLKFWWQLLCSIQLIKIFKKKMS